MKNSLKKILNSNKFVNLVIGYKRVSFFFKKK